MPHGIDRRNADRDHAGGLGHAGLGAERHRRLGDGRGRDPSSRPPPCRRSTDGLVKAGPGAMVNRLRPRATYGKSRTLKLSRRTQGLRRFAAPGTPAGSTSPAPGCASPDPLRPRPRGGVRLERRVEQFDQLAHPPSVRGQKLGLGGGRLRRGHRICLAVSPWAVRRRLAPADHHRCDRPVRLPREEQLGPAMTFTSPRSARRSRSPPTRRRRPTPRPVGRQATPDHGGAHDLVRLDVRPLRRLPLRRRLRRLLLRTLLLPT